MNLSMCFALRLFKIKYDKALFQYTLTTDIEAHAPANQYNKL